MLQILAQKRGIAYCGNGVRLIDLSLTEILILTEFMIREFGDEAANTELNKLWKRGNGFSRNITREDKLKALGRLPT